MYVWDVCMECVYVCSDMISEQLDQYTRVLREVDLSCGNSVTAARLQCLLGNLIAQSLHHRDIAQSQFTLSLIHHCAY